MLFKSHLNNTFTYKNTMQNASNNLHKSIKIAIFTSVN